MKIDNKIIIKFHTDFKYISNLENELELKKQIGLRLKYILKNEDKFINAITNKIEKEAMIKILALKKEFNINILNFRNFINFIRDNQKKPSFNIKEERSFYLFYNYNFKDKVGQDKLKRYTEIFRLQTLFPLIQTLFNNPDNIFLDRNYITMQKIKDFRIKFKRNPITKNNPKTDKEKEELKLSFLYNRIKANNYKILRNIKNIRLIEINNFINEGKQLLEQSKKEKIIKPYKVVLKWIKDNKKLPIPSKNQVIYQKMSRMIINDFKFQIEQGQNVSELKELIKKYKK